MAVQRIVIIPSSGQMSLGAQPSPLPAPRGEAKPKGLSPAAAAVSRIVLPGMVALIRLSHILLVKPGEAH
jgi:hypothetical protein